MSEHLIHTILEGLKSVDTHRKDVLLVGDIVKSTSKAPDPNQKLSRPRRALKTFARFFGSPNLGLLLTVALAPLVVASAPFGIAVLGPVFAGIAVTSAVYNYTRNYRRTRNIRLAQHKIKEVDKSLSKLDFVKKISKDLGKGDNISKTITELNDANLAKLKESLQSKINAKGHDKSSIRKAAGEVDKGLKYVNFTPALMQAGGLIASGPVMGTIGVVNVVLGQGVTVAAEKNYRKSKDFLDTKLIEQKTKVAEMLGLGEKKDGKFVLQEGVLNAIDQEVIDKVNEHSAKMVAVARAAATKGLKGESIDAQELQYKYQKTEVEVTSPPRTFAEYVKNGFDGEKTSGMRDMSVDKNIKKNSEIKIETQGQTRRRSASVGIPSDLKPELKRSRSMANISDNIRKQVNEAKSHHPIPDHATNNIPRPRGNSVNSAKSR